MTNFSLFITLILPDFGAKIKGKIEEAPLSFYRQKRF